MPCRGWRLATISSLNTPFLAGQEDGIDEAPDERLLPPPPLLFVKLQLGLLELHRENGIGALESLAALSFGPQRVAQRTHLGFEPRRAVPPVELERLDSLVRLSERNRLRMARSKQLTEVDRDTIDIVL